MTPRRLPILAILLTISLFTTYTPAAPDPASLEFFETKVRPVLADRCYKCHSAASEKLKGDLRLDSPASILKGGTSDLPAVVPHKPDDSLLIKAVRYELDDLQMPPKQKLPPNQIADLVAWVNMGAPLPPESPTTAPSSSGHPVRMSLADGRNFWSFKLPNEPKIPVFTPENRWPRNDIDRFILQKLNDNHLTPSPEADRRTLIRRATYDLIGLPPTADQVDSFVNDPDPNAYEHLIDRLLASPQYGERYARHWLDVARYADTKGYVFNEDRRYPFAYTYRDWVINALNADLPYDQFLLNQIAADRLVKKSPPLTPSPGTPGEGGGEGPSSPSSILDSPSSPPSPPNPNLAALGFLTVGRRFINNQTDIIDDRIDVVCRGTMGLTVACARCHDHKYDPIPTADYYSLYGVFASSTEPALPPPLGTPDPHNPQAAEFQKDLTAATAARDDFLKTRHAELTKSIRTPAEIARYLLAAQKGVAAEQHLDYEVIDDGKSPTPWLVKRWERALKESTRLNGQVFAPWRALSTLPAADFPTKAPAILASLTTANPVVLAELNAAPPLKSVHDLANRYGALLSKYDREQPSPDPNTEAIRLVTRRQESPLNVDLKDAEKLFTKPDHDKLATLRTAITTLLVTHPGSPPRAMAMEDLPTPVEPHIFKRGNPGSPGDATPRQFLAILSPEKRTPFTNGSGRLELAQDIVSPENPLTARVLVNRIWQWHFGKALVRTPSDFGTRGDPPTHPELLDYLALRFTHDDHWSLKQLHKRIMLSSTYRQSSYPPSQLATTSSDPDNRLLSHFNPQRLDFEQLRDSLLSASGQLDPQMNGRPVDITTPPFPTRRSVYAYIDRQNLPGLFRTFDFASPDMHSPQRPATSVPQQALFLLNSPFVLDQAKTLAARSANPDSATRITQLYRLALGRSPTPDELSLGIRYIQSESSTPPEPIVSTPSPWSYGYASYDDATARLKSFTPLPHFTPNSGWQGGAKLPDPRLGWALLSPTGGHPGDNPAHAVARRFTAPHDCTLSLEGSLAHTPTAGDGVRARIISSHEGTLATYLVHARTAQTQISPIPLKQGETLDFLTDCGPNNDFNSDSFSWHITLTELPTPNAPAGQDNSPSYNSTTQFTGPPPQPPTPLTPWEKYAQVLLQSNEFMFID